MKVLKSTVKKSTSIMVLNELRDSLKESIWIAAAKSTLIQRSIIDVLKFNGEDTLTKYQDLSETISEPDWMAF